MEVAEGLRKMGDKGRSWRPNYVGPDGIVRHQRTDFVYFIRMGDDGPIKIGHALSPRDRLAELQTGNPYRLYLLHVVEGGEPLERRLHEELASYRLEGEWFEPTERVRKVILREAMSALRARQAA